MKVYTIDNIRHGDHSQMMTGIYVRAVDKTTGKADSYDIASLDKPSLLSWLRSRSGYNPWAENVVALLLGHEPFTAGLTPARWPAPGPGRPGRPAAPVEPPKKAPI